MLKYSYDGSGNVVIQTPGDIVPPEITGQPVNQIAAPGETATFSVVVVDARGVTFQWKRDGVDIPGATDDSVLLSNVKTEDDKTKYSVVVENSADSMTSAAAELRIDSDGDGLPDSWERAEFTDQDPNQPLHPRNQRSETDPDKDGISNLDEFLDGTVPTDAGSLRPRLTVYSEAGGSVAVAPVKLSYKLGDSVILTATPFSPSKFVGWAGDVKGMKNPATVIMDRNKTVRARFASAAPLPLGLIALWRGDTDGKRAIDLIGRHHGDFFIEANAAPPRVTVGKIGSAFDFDGNVYVRVDERDDDPAALRPARFTIEAWVFPTKNTGSHQTIIAKGSSRLDSNTWYLGLNGMNPEFITHDNSLIQGPPIPLNEWTHLAGTFDGTSKRLYVNGVVEGRADHSSEINLGPLIYDPGVPVTIGSDWARNVSSERFIGLIDEVALYNRALMTNEIPAIYNADFIGKDFSRPYFISPSRLPDAALAVDYRHQLAAIFGTGPVSFSLSQGTLPREIALSSDGVVSGVPRTAGIFHFTIRATAIDLVKPPQTTAAGAFAEQICMMQVFGPIRAPDGLVGWWRAEKDALDSANSYDGKLRGAGFAVGRVGQAFALDGKDDCIEIPDAPALRPESVTLEAWVAFDVTTAPPQIVIAKARSGLSDSYALWLESGTTLKGEARGPALSASFSPEPGSWHHLAYTFDHKTKQQVLYIDGIKVASGTASGEIFYTDQPLLLGCKMQNNARISFLNGRIDEASIYNRALKGEEIESIFGAGPAGKTLD